MLTNKLTGAGAADKTYIEDVFSTYLYTGNGSTQTINNGIDLAGKGGLVWTKARTLAASNSLQDTVRGAGNYLASNSTNANTSYPSSVTSFNSNGFSLGADAGYGVCNASGYNYASWTFRKAPKFFDVVTYTGNGASTKTINHSLGQVPGMIIIKKTSSASSLGWTVWHRSLSSGYHLLLNTTAAQTFDSVMQGANAPTDTTFTAQLSVTDGLNSNGETYVAYLFAHDTTTDGLIQCGSVTLDGTSTYQDVNLGWEPQFVLTKNATSTSNWFINDNMRGMPVDTNSNLLVPNTSGAEVSSNVTRPTATGFKINNALGSGVTYIYMAIRRGPMRTPTDGTKVFQPISRTGTGTTTTVTTTLTPDLAIIQPRNAVRSGAFWTDRLRGSGLLQSAAATEEVTSTTYFPTQMWDNQYGFDIGTSPDVNSTAYTYANYAFKRAPGFFDVVCYTSTNATQTVNHNLTVAPELIITKIRDSTGNWNIATSFGVSGFKFLVLNSTVGAYDGTYDGSWLYSSKPSATSFDFNYPGVQTFVSYLFASCPGVSKVGSYTGNGSSQTINCGFSAGARFVLIKRTDSTGDWYVWDTARGIVASNDPHLSLNTTTAEVTTDDTIDPDSTGFIVNQVAATNVNVNAATYIYLAIA